MKKIILFLRWLLAALFTLCLFGIGLHWSGLLLIGAILLVLPIPIVEGFLSKCNIKGLFSLLLAFILVIIAIASAPIAQQNSSAEKTEETKTEESNSTTETTPTSTNTKNTTRKTTVTTKPTTTTTESTTTTTKPTTTTTETEPKSEMVWVPSSGKKYHSHAGCSGMNNPEEITIEEAEELGYTPCKRCYG